MAGGTAPCVLNAADEVAVAAFLDGRLPFTGIAEVIARGARAHPAPTPVAHFERAVRVRPRGARACAAELVSSRRNGVSAR